MLIGSTIVHRIESVLSYDHIHDNDGKVKRLAKGHSSSVPAFCFEMNLVFHLPRYEDVELPSSEHERFRM